MAKTVTVELTTGVVPEGASICGKCTYSDICTIRANMADVEDSVWRMLKPNGKYWMWMTYISKCDYLIEPIDVNN